MFKFNPLRSFHLRASIKTRLILGFCATMSLVAILASFTFIGTAKISAAHDKVSENLKMASATREQAEKTTAWINILNNTKSRHDTELRLMAQALLENVTKAELDSIRPGTAISQLINHAQRQTLETSTPELKNEFKHLDLIRNQVLISSEKIKKLWHARHEGLEQELNDLKRTQIYWTLKVANMLFVKSSITALVKEELEQTPMEQFKAGAVYRKHAPQFDILRTKIAAAATSNEELWKVSHKLNDMMMRGQWEQARILYRDKIPTLTKSMSVDIDSILQIENYVLKSQKKAIDLLNNELIPQAREASTALDQLHIILDKTMTAKSSLVEERSRALAHSQLTTDALISRIQDVSVLLSVVIFLMGGGGGWLLIRSIVGPLRQSVEMIKHLDAGNLRQRLHMQRNDEIGEMATLLDSFADHLEHDILHAFQKLAAGDFTFKAQGIISEPLTRANHALTHLIASIRSMGKQLNMETSHMVASGQELSSGAALQTKELQHISESMEQLAAEINANLESTRNASNQAQRSNACVQRGYSSIESMVDSMEEINQAGQNVQKIIAVIDEIAFQTNLLALNAAVEAARAGQHGKGFAVVAEEVRNLASRSARAAAETSELIEGSIRKGGAGLQIAKNTKEVLDEIVTEVAAVTDLVGNIATSSHSQAEQIKEINSSLERIEEVTERSNVAVHQSAQSAAEISQQAETLHRMLDSFKLEQKHQLKENSSSACNRACPQAENKTNAPGSARVESTMLLLGDNAKLQPSG